MLVSLEGIDGAGKTTIAQEVAKRLPNQVTFQSRKSIVSPSKYANSIAEQLARILWGSGDSRDVSPAFWLHAQAAWYVLLGENRDLDSRIALTDGWYYKFLARLHVQGYSLEWLEATFQRVPRPNEVILLDVEPSTAWNRKRFRPLETGLHLAEEQDGYDGFVFYQNGTLGILREMAGRDGWRTLSVGAHEPLEITVQRVVELIEPLNRRARAV